MDLSDNSSGEKGTLADFLKSERFNRQLSQSAELLRLSPNRSYHSGVRSLDSSPRRVSPRAQSPSSSSSDSSKDGSRVKKGGGFLLKLSPKRLLANRRRNSESMVTEVASDTEADDAVISPRSISSKDYFKNEGKLNFKNINQRRSSLNLLSSRGSPRSVSPPLSSIRSAPDSPNYSLGSVEKAKARGDGFYRCHSCRRQLSIDRYLEMFLAVKCPCPEPPYFFCNRECQKIHWISLHGKRDKCADMLYRNGLMSEKLDWNKPEDHQYRFPLNEYVPCDRYL